MPDTSSFPLHDLLGLSPVLRESGRVVLGLSLRNDLLNRRGVLHGGVVSAALDAALGGAVVSGIAPEEWCATLQLSVQFLAAARHGPFEAEGRMTGRGRRVAFAGGELRDGSGAVVARAHGTWHVWPRKPD